VHSQFGLKREPAHYADPNPRAGAKAPLNNRLGHFCVTFSIIIGYAGGR
jgi:hypothetical protein